jgi:hypothetical protein
VRKEIGWGEGRDRGAPLANRCGLRVVRCRFGLEGLGFRILCDL